MTLSHATSDRDWCKLDDLVNIPCFTLRGLLYEMYAVLNASEQKTGQGSNAQSSQTPRVAVKDCGREGHTSEGPDWPERHPSGCQ